MEARRFEEQLKALPQKPGVYLFRDASGNVLYVGKGANLHNRVRSYFGAPQVLSPKLQRMVARVSDFEFFVTDSEQEALILECNLIKKHRPRYNVRLKDDKTYPYLKINVKDDWARVSITRRVEKDGSRYFGPYASAGSVRKTLDLLKKLFPFRTCKKEITGTDRRPCLEYDIHRCAGPCIGAISKEEYRDIINHVIMFLEGKQEVINELERKMEEASERLEFERAAVIRDQIKAVQKVME
ncbi:MAG: excinuclease ABC subunit C, partial [Chloroflexi bacterium]